MSTAPPDAESAMRGLLDALANRDDELTAYYWDIACLLLGRYCDPYVNHPPQLAAVRAERDELRACLAWAFGMLPDLNHIYDDDLADLARARVALAKELTRG